MLTYFLPVSRRDIRGKTPFVADSALIAVASGVCAHIFLNPDSPGP